MEEDLSELWLNNLKDLISSQNAKIKQMKSDNEILSNQNKSLKVSLVTMETKNAQLENKLDVLKDVLDIFKGFESFGKCSDRKSIESFERSLERFVNKMFF